MKKTLSLLLFIPLLSYSQTYDDIMNMNSEKNFIRTMIENGYQKLIEHSTDSMIVYGLNHSNFLDIEKVDKMGIYHKYNDVFMISDVEKTDYKTIIEKIKKNCEYYDIMDNNGTDFLCYSCPQSKYSGKIGYTVMEGMGTILHFPKEE
tara:strand:+ start:286 stop:729 length:444 start_codon:yes stop_codon:yes gene_type:complete